MRPLLIQNAGLDPAYAAHPAVRFGLTRYLGVPIFDPSGAATGTLCFLDGRSEAPLGQADVEFMTLLAMRVSAELERERAIERRVAEERAARERLARLNERLRQGEEERRRFVTTLLHDLRQPLAAMQTLLYLARREEDAAERAETLAALDHRLAAVCALVQELGEYARMESGELPWNVEATDLSQLLEDCLSGLAAEAAARRVQLRFELDEGLGITFTDASKLRRIVSNLVGNAIKFSARSDEEPERAGGAAGRVTVRACADSRASWLLEVEDNGIGIDEAEVERIFDCFYQGSAARMSEERANAPRGLGLGLAIVRQFCDALGAAVEVRGRPGVGASFRVRFPRDCRASSGKSGGGPDTVTLL